MNIKGELWGVLIKSSCSSLVRFFIIFFSAKNMKIYFRIVKFFLKLRSTIFENFWQVDRSIISDSWSDNIESINGLQLGNYWPINYWSMIDQWSFIDPSIVKRTMWVLIQFFSFSLRFTFNFNFTIWNDGWKLIAQSVSSLVNTSMHERYGSCIILNLCSRSGAWKCSTFFVFFFFTSVKFPLFSRVCALTRQIPRNKQRNLHYNDGKKDNSSVDNSWIRVDNLNSYAPDNKNS